MMCIPDYAVIRMADLSNPLRALSDKEDNVEETFQEAESYRLEERTL
jgi:hypothetical protein